MKKYILAATLLLNATTAHTLVVSDPGAYARIAQTIQQGVEIIEEAQAIYQEAQEIKNNLSGNLQRGRGIEEFIRNYKDDLEGMLPSLYHKLPEDLKDTFNQAISEKLDEKVISRSVDATMSELTKEQQQDHKQKVLKRTLVMSEATAKDMESSLNKLESLALEIDQTQTLKDAVDLNNRLQQEMLLNQTKMINLLAELTRAEAIMNYTGTDNNSQPSQRLMTSDEYTLELGRGSTYWEVNENIGDIE